VEDWVLGREKSKARNLETEHITWLRGGCLVREEDSASS